ncbi:hypothetical protein GCM10007973_08570 [Polymorphobacter multimanifer]|uniref:Uncharacterized protein n=1 Tax=Polymorphobacter multimanifer TaxID=1070431 RepID=A0A841LE38_9SPHN|nr:hypothetical protein [Polymorphobacter multimanifer]MBB6228075.1 hypothetical protein [Polymorphobacter multimanifer]GGI74024.1 hypothetical protein GCM10007973_08570 [Polymorphobacter multimanifer]
MKWLTEDALLVCDHRGKVDNRPSQAFVRIEGRRVLVATDPEGRGISGCPNANPLAGIRPCLTTMKVDEGYSTLVRIAGRPVALDALKGRTDGTPPATVDYIVQRPGQSLVKARS